MDKKKVTLNVMLLKQGLDLNNPDTFINEFNSGQTIDIEKGDVDALLYMKKGANKKPDWATSFQKKIGGVNLAQLVPGNQSSGVSLFIKVQGRIFAINWGRLATHYIAKSAIDRKFGIYTANKLFNDEEGAKLKSAQSRVNETNPINKQRQYGESVSYQELSLSMEDNEALNELTVLNTQSENFYRLIGKYSSLNVQFAFGKTQIPCLEHLPEKLQKLLEIYQSVTNDDVKKLFKGIYPKDDGTDELFLELEAKLISNPDYFFLFEPDIDFDFSSVAQFKITSGASEVISEDFSLSNYLNICGNPSKVNLENDTIHVIDEDGDEIKTWSILDCLYGEVEVNGTNFIISHGDWFEVNKDKYERIKDKIDGILDDSFIVNDVVKNNTKQSIADFVLQNPNTKIEKERIFNTHLSSDLDGQLFDEISKQITLYEDRFEVCDVYLPLPNKFIHVKYNSGASALSHLFNQGFVSASAFARHKNEYIAKVNAHMPNPIHHLPHRDRACIHFLLINDKRENRLSFFSKMVLEDKITTLEAMNFDVKLSWVSNVY